MWLQQPSRSGALVFPSLSEFSTVYCDPYSRSKFPCKLQGNDRSFLIFPVNSCAGSKVLEKGMATHSSILPWRIPWIEKPGVHSPWTLKEYDMTEHLTCSLSPKHTLLLDYGTCCKSWDLKYGERKISYLYNYLYFKFY